MTVQSTHCALYRGIITIINVTVVKIKVVSPLRGCLKATITGEVAYLISTSGDNFKSDWILKKPPNLENENKL